MTGCCNPFTGVCERGFNCPAGSELPLSVLDKLPAPKYCDRSKQPCTSPYTCNPLCRLIDSHLPIEMFEPPRWYRMPGAMTAFFTIACALIAFAAAVYQTF